MLHRPPLAPDPRLDRAMAALLGGALGDALGMPSQTLPRAEIAARYGRINDFVAPFPGHPVSHGLPAGAVTDDTEQTLLLARRLIAEPFRFDAQGWARDLLGWEADVAARGLHDLLGPSSKAALKALQAGAAVDQAGRHGTTNGAAMRIAPVGIATPPEPLPAFLARVQDSCRVTHNTAEALAAAAAVAMAISAGIAGAGFAEASALALQAATAAAELGHPVGQSDIADRIAAALALAECGPAPEAFAEAIGTSVASHHAIPAAFGIVRLAGGDPWQAAVIAANIGDDTDTIAAIACAVAAACSGMASLPADKIARLIAVNRLDIAPIATALLAQRDRPGGAA